jgi:hypothetical protein
LPWSRRTAADRGAPVSAYFNAVEKNLPVTVALDRVSSPLGHKLLVRSDLKDQIKSVAALKGRRLASNLRGSITNYEIGKILRPSGLGFRTWTPVSSVLQVALAFCQQGDRRRFRDPAIRGQIVSAASPPSSRSTISFRAASADDRGLFPSIPTGRRRTTRW